jgi:hypothetical protein
MRSGMSNSDGIRSNAWRSIFDDHLAVWSHLPSVSDRLSELGFMQSIYSIIRCVRSEEEDFARREIKKVLKNTREIEDQVEMNSKVLKQCLKAITESLIDTVWHEDFIDDPVSHRDVRKQVVTESSYQVQSRDSSESIPPKRRIMKSRNEVKNHEFEEKSRATAPSSRMNPKSTTKDSTTLQQAELNGIHNGNSAPGSNNQIQSERNKKLQPDLSTSKMSQFKSPQATKKLSNQDKMPSRLTSPKADIVNIRNTGSKAQLTVNKVEESKDISKHTSNISRKPNTIEPKPNHTQPKNTKNDGSHIQSKSKLRGNESRPAIGQTDGPPSPSSVVEAEGRHRQPPLHPVSPPKHSADIRDIVNDSCLPEEMPKDDVFAKKLAISVKKKLLGNTAPLDVPFN